MNRISTSNLRCLCICVLLLITAWLPSGKVFAQTTISGKIVDSLTNEPLTSASVFLANESKSTSSLSDGTFKINNVAPGKHIVIISYIGYQKFVKAILIQGSSPVAIIAHLQPVVQTLNDVTVGVPLSPKNRAILVEKFEKALFGNSENASKCKIINPGVLDITFDKKNNILNASCDSFLLVRNSALGYNINILLDGFVYDYNSRARTYLGKIYFSEISGSNAEHKKWERKRAETYLGSLRHFLKTTISSTFKQEGFDVHPIITEIDTQELGDALIANKIKQFENGNADSLRRWKDIQLATLKHYIVNDKFLTEKDLVKESDKPGLYELKFDKHIHFTATRKRVLAANGTYQLATTILTLNTAKTIFDVNGILMRPGDLISQGENTETIADLLPNDYTLSKKDEKLFSPANNPDNGAKSNITNNYFEKLYLQTSRYLYNSGDNVWLSAYLVNARNNRLSGHSSKLYIELISSNNKILTRRVIKLENGVAAGEILLDDTLVTGIYRIRAYTNWIRNFGNDFVFEKEIEIKGKMPASLSPAVITKPIKNEAISAGIIPKASKPIIHFYPESGSLITDVYARVAFTATDSSGTPFQVAGKIITATGDSICTATSNTNGVGDFLIKPKPGLTYYFVTQDNRTTVSSILPEGYSLFVQEKDSVFNILISTNPLTLKKDSGKKFKLLIKHAGINIAELSVTVKLLQQLVKVPKNVLFHGINVISLEDADSRPLAERLIFGDNKPKLNVSMQKHISTHNDKVDISISLTDSLGNPFKGHMLVSVIPREQHNANIDNVMSYLLISSEVKGAMYNPSQYFDESNPDRKNQLDLLLLTQGWRDYLWKYHSTPIAGPAKYNAEAGFELQGSIVKNNGTAAANIPVSLYIPGAKQQKLYTTQTDIAGNYNFLLDEVYGNQTYTISAVDSKGQAFGMVQAKLANTDTLTLAPEGKRKATDYPQTQKLSLLTADQARAPLKTMENTVQKLKEVKVESRAKTQLLEGSFTTFGYREENFEITPADYDFKDLKHYILTKSSYATQDRSSSIYVCNGEHEGSMCKHAPMVSKRPATCPCGAELTLTATEASDRIMFSGEDSLITPQLFVNGRQILIRGTNSDVGNNAIYQQYLNLSMKEVSFVKIRKVLINNNGINKTGYLLYIDLKQGMQARDGKFNGVFEGYYQAKMFYTPENKGSPVALLNNTKELYWKPDILTGSKDPHTFSMFTQGIRGEYVIAVEGLTDIGVPFYKVIKCNFP